MVAPTRTAKTVISPMASEFRVRAHAFPSSSTSHSGEDSQYSHRTASSEIEQHARLVPFSDASHASLHSAESGGWVWVGRVSERKTKHKTGMETAFMCLCGQGGGGQSGEG